jgi:hypothetical protein
MSPRTFIFILLLAGSGLNIPQVAAADLTPQTYVVADIKARQVTITGMEKRLVLLQGGKGINDQMALSSQTQDQVNTVYKQSGTTAQSHAAYAASHAKEITAWLNQHPEIMTQYNQLRTRFLQLSGSLESARSR